MIDYHIFLFDAGVINDAVVVVVAFLVFHFIFYKLKNGKDLVYIFYYNLIVKLTAVSFQYQIISFLKVY